MKIKFILWSTELAGGPRAIFEIANRLKDRGYNVGIVSLGGSHTWFKVKVPVEYISLPEYLKKILLLYSILKFKRKNPDVFVVEAIAKKLGFYVDLIRMLSEHILPGVDAYIATYYPTAISLYLSDTEGFRLYFPMDFPEAVEETAGRYGLKLFELSLKLPFDAFLCISSYVRDLIVGVQPSARIVITGAGVDTSIFRPRKSNVMDLRDRKRIMIIVRGLKYKGDEVAIEALNIVSLRIPIHAIVVGYRSIVNKLFRKVKPRFTYSIFEGIDDDMLAKLYSSADVFLFTSYAEGFGLPPLEAMACGTPVVTTDCKGNRDYVKDSYNALVIPPGDPKMVADAIMRVLIDDKLREKLIDGGLETVKQWTWDKVVDRFEEALRLVSMSKSY